MKSVLWINIQFAFLFIFSMVSAQESTDIDANQLSKEFSIQTNEWIKAYNSMDANNLIPLYTQDAIYISGHVNGLELNGLKNVIAYFQNGINGGGHIDKIEILSMNLSCDIATLLCKYQATNSGVTVEGRNLLVMKKINEKWLIAVHMTVV
jgi:ketosteroid isomerase-like protein